MPWRTQNDAWQLALAALLLDHSPVWSLYSTYMDPSVLRCTNSMPPSSLGTSWVLFRSFHSPRVEWLLFPALLSLYDYFQSTAITSQSPVYHLLPLDYVTLANIASSSPFCLLSFLPSLTQSRCLVLLPAVPVPEAHAPGPRYRSPMSSEPFARIDPTQLRFCFTEGSVTPSITPNYSSRYTSPQRPLGGPSAPRPGLPHSLLRSLLSSPSRSPPSCTRPGAKFAPTPIDNAQERKISELPVLRLWKTFLINQNGFS